MKKMTKKPRFDPLLSFILILSAMCIIVMGLIFRLEQNSLRQSHSTLPEAALEHHYVMILDEKDASFWKSVYLGAQKAARSCHACVELMDEGPFLESGMADRLDLAIAAQVDGIILCPNGAEEVNMRVEQAEEQGIPVVTIMNSGNCRVHVGINSYDMGSAYGELIRMMQQKEEIHSVVMLLPEGSRNQTIDNARMTDCLSGCDITLASQSINAGDIFSTEMKIQELVNADQPPDILICPDSRIGMSAYRVLVDCNRVGMVHLLVSYANSEILEEIEKGGIDASVTVDAAEMGQKCLENLDELVRQGRTNDYTAMDLSVVDKNNVNSFRRSMEAVR